MVDSPPIYAGGQLRRAMQSTIHSKTFGRKRAVPGDAFGWGERLLLSEIQEYPFNILVAHLRPFIALILGVKLE